MECPAGTVMSRLYRGRKILQGLLHDYAVEQGIISARGREGRRAGAGRADAPVDFEAYRRQREGRGRGGRMTCNEADAFGQAYVDGELAGVDRETVERHLAGCASCVSACGSRRGSRRRFAPTCRGPGAVRATPAAAGGPRRAADRAPALAAGSRPARWCPRRRLCCCSSASPGPCGARTRVVLEQAERSYHTELPMDIVGSDCGSISSWFRGRVDFPVPRSRARPRRPARAAAWSTSANGRLPTSSTR